MREYKPEPEEPLEDEFDNPSRGLLLGVAIALIFWTGVCGIAALVIYCIE